MSANRINVTDADLEVAAEFGPARLTAADRVELNAWIDARAKAPTDDEFDAMWAAEMQRRDRAGAA